jgi:transposase-like protein
MAGNALQKTYDGCNGNNLPENIGQSLLNAFQKRQEGRASQFTEEKAITILESIMDGSTVQQACDKVGISRTTFYTWRSLVPEFPNMIALAHEMQADSMVDDNVKLLENVDVTSEDADPRRLMAQLRKAEQVARFKFDLAKCLNNKYVEKKQNLNVNLNANVSDADVSKWFNR